MKCKICGNEVGNTKFCPYCGTPVRQVSFSEADVLAVVISKAREGDRQAQQTLMQYVYNDLYNEARGMVDDANSVRTIVNNACVSVLNYLPNLENSNQFRIWSLKFVQAEAVRHLKSKYSAYQMNTGMNALYDSSDERISPQLNLNLDNASIEDLLLQTLNQLPEDQRIVVIMYFYDHLKLNEIADALGLSPSETVSRLQKAKEQIKQSIPLQQTKHKLNADSLTPMGLFISLMMMWKNNATAAGKNILMDAAVKLGIGGTAVTSAVNAASHGTAVVGAGQAGIAGTAVRKSVKSGIAGTAVNGVAKATVGLPLAGKLAIGAIAGCVAIAGTIGIHKLITDKNKTNPEENTNLLEEQYGIVADARPALVSPEELIYTTEVSANVNNDYTVASDFSNVLNAEDLELYSDEVKQMLRDQNFAVADRFSPEFAAEYIGNHENLQASFVTVDSMLHSFHLVYATVQENIERDYLSQTAKEMATKLLTVSQSQLSALQGTEWESAAQRNVDYFSIAAALAGSEVSLSDVASQEYDRVMASEGMELSPLLTAGDQSLSINYGAFKPQGYYEHSESLKSYYRIMKWFGTVSYMQSIEDLDRSALLMSLAMADESAKEEWEKLYKVTTFFAGESNDNGFYDYYPVIRHVYGDDVTVNALAGDESKFKEYHTLTEQLKEPKINGKTMDEESTKGYRVMGARFSIDAEALNNLVFPNIKENSGGEKRYLPSAIEVPAALGSDEALNIVNTMTDVSAYPDYSSKMEEVRQTVNAYTDADWGKSVSSAWLNTLRPLTRNDMSGYPAFMQSDAWKRKNLNSFLGSYTELKHDMVLYSELTGTGLGADGPREKDTRGYVEPEPEVFGRLEKLANATNSGLKGYSLISDDDSMYLEKLATLASSLRTISEKELRNELPTKEEFDLIDKYGDYLEEFWKKSLENKIEPGENPEIFSGDYPCTLVTDLANDNENQTVLQIGVGYAQKIVVLVNFDGHIRPAFGAVYSFYEMVNPQTERYIDSSWKEAVKAGWPKTPDLPEWESSFNESAFVRDENGAIGTIQVLSGSAQIQASKHSYGKEPVEILSASDTKIPVYYRGTSYSTIYYNIGENKWLSVSGYPQPDDPVIKFEKN